MWKLVYSREFELLKELCCNSAKEELPISSVDSLLLLSGSLENFSGNRANQSVVICKAVGIGGGGVLGGEGLSIGMNADSEGIICITLHTGLN